MDAIGSRLVTTAVMGRARIAGMADRPFYAPNVRPEPREPRPGRLMWTATKGSHLVRCELRADQQRSCFVPNRSGPRPSAIYSPKTVTPSADGT